MDAATTYDDTARMDTHTRMELMDRAEELAFEAFGQDADVEHVKAVFDALARRWLSGLPADGVVTVH